MTLSRVEFVRRLTLHILPARFVKIRHYGLLANRGRQARLGAARRLLGAPEPPDESQTGEVHRSENPAAALVCPHCGKRQLVLVRVMPTPWRGQLAILDSS